MRILDFGLAKLRDGPAMTAGMAVGTPSYMSPEQSARTARSTRAPTSTRWACVLFEMLTGRKPFQSENVGEVILMQRETAAAQAARDRARGELFASSSRLLIDKAMSKLPEDRFQSAAELAAALAATPEGKAALGDVERAQARCQAGGGENLADRRQKRQRRQGGMAAVAAGGRGGGKDRASRRRRC